MTAKEERQRDGGAGGAAPAGAALEQAFDKGTLYALRAAVAAHAAAAGLGPSQVYDVTAVAHELAANAVVHGAKEDPTKIVECLVACDDRCGVLIIVRDPGQGFDPQAIPSCTMGENLYSNHGRGIFLINQLMDEVKFHKNGTEIHMVKR